MPFRVSKRRRQWVGLHENRTINVDHQLQYSGKKSYRVETPKTENGIRKIPMSDRVLKALQRVIQSRRKSTFKVDGLQASSFSQGTKHLKIALTMILCFVNL